MSSRQQVLGDRFIRSYFLFLRFHFQRCRPPPAEWPEFRGPGGQGHSSERGHSPRVERNKERRLEGTGPRPRMVVTGHQQRAGVDDDVRRGDGRRVAARARVRRRDGARAPQRRSLQAVERQSQEPQEQSCLAHADRRGRSRVRAFRRRRHGRARRGVRRDRLDEEISVRIAARQRGIAGAPRRSADLQRRRPLRGVGHRARQAHG